MPKKFALRPDIVFTCNDETMIADTKWKIIREEKEISQADMYQLFAYGKKYNNKKLFLIYPKDGDDQPRRLSYDYEEMLNLKVLGLIYLKTLIFCNRNKILLLLKN